MGRSPCCDKVGLKKGPWTPEEDQKLLSCIQQFGHGSWRVFPAKAGLQRCGKSCRLRWTNYLRPDIKRGQFTSQEEKTIIQLHALLGNRWSAIATHLPKRTDNEIKNYWNTHLKKKLAKMGIDPVTHKPKNDALLSVDGRTNKNAANLGHMAQWETARLEAEARLVRESKLRSQHQFYGFPCSSASSSASHSLDVLKAFNVGLLKTNEGISSDLESPTSILTFSETALPIISICNGLADSKMTGGSSSGSFEARIVKEECKQDWKFYEINSSHHEGLLGFEDGMDANPMTYTSSTLNGMAMSMEGGTWSSTPESQKTNGGDHVGNVNTTEEGFTYLLLNDSDGWSNLSDGGGEPVHGDATGGDYNEDNKTSWNSILDLVNSPPTGSPMF